MPLAHELGDALRSWCNPAGEDATEVRFDLELARAALHGWAEEARALLQPGEAESLAVGVHTIALELAARFLADALNESYFGWDEARYASRSAHNLVRGKGQLALAESIAAQWPELLALARGL